MGKCIVGLRDRGKAVVACCGREYAGGGVKPVKRRDLMLLLRLGDDGGGRASWPE